MPTPIRAIKKAAINPHHGITITTSIPKPQLVSATPIVLFLILHHPHDTIYSIFSDQVTKLSTFFYKKIYNIVDKVVMS